MDLRRLEDDAHGAPGSGLLLLLLTCKDRNGLQTARVRAAEESDRHGTGPVGAGLPLDLKGRTGGDHFALGRLGDRVEARGLGQDGAREGEKRSADGETHFE